jgi:uncharacterized Zn finger protein
MARRKYSYYDFYYEPTRPIEVDDGIKARSRRGDFAKNWWARRWIQAMERLVDPGRLARGRSYARKGQVRSIEETQGGIRARVQGSRPSPYKVTIQVSPLSEAQWEKVIDALAEQAIFTAQLLAGEMPQDIEQAFQSAGVSLFPEKGGDLETNCSCPDWSNPCKHVAAAHYILGERFDEDPFLLFRLRGRTQEQILQALRQRRAGQASFAEEEEEEEAETIIPLEEALERFYELGAPLEGFSLSIREVAIEMPLLKRLGEAAFVPAPGIQPLLRPVYQGISQAALEAAFQERTGEENGGAPVK